MEVLRTTFILVILSCATERMRGSAAKDLLCRRFVSGRAFRRADGPKTCNSWEKADCGPSRTQSRQGRHGKAQDGKFREGCVIDFGLR